MKKNKMNFSEERHCKELESLGSVFMPIMKGVLDGNDFIEADIMLNWIDIIGWDIASFCYPIKAKFNPKTDERTLFLEVPVGGFALELQHREQYILDKINSYFGYKSFHKISISQNANIRLRIPPQKTKKDIRSNFTDSEKKYLTDILDGINDDKLKEILTKLGENVISTNKEKE